MSASRGAFLNFPLKPAERQRFNGIPTVLAAIVLSTLLAAGCAQDESREGTAPPPIELRGSVRPVRSSTITAQVDGVVESVAVTDGGSVSVNGSIVQLSNPAIERDAEVARAQLALIDARLRRSGRPLTTPRAAPSESLEITAQILELRKARLDKMKALRGTNDVTAGDLQQAEVEYLAALRDYRNERRLPAGEAFIDDREVLQIERQKIVADQKFAVHRQSLLSIRSPFAGVVTRLLVTAGQPVYPRDPIADVADLSTLQVRAGIAADLLRFVRPGMRVDVKVLSTPVRTFADEIDAIIPASQAAAGGEAALPTVVITIPNPDFSLQANTEAIVTLRSVQ
jgi:multidrug resistance efflux pump